VRQTEEALELSAPLARRLAPELCRRDPATGESCAWSHGFWQYLRLMDLAVEPALHAGFYQRAVEELLARHRAPRILISGAVDYALLALILGTLRARGAQAHVTVLDQCETPLEMNRWYAQRLGVAIDTQRSDILAFAPGRAYDAICTHAFLGYFDAAQRAALFARWRGLLSTGGSLITAHRLRPGQAQCASFTAEQASAYRARVLRLAQTKRDALDLEPAALADMAERYASRLRMWPVASLDEVRGLCAQAGLEVHRLFAAPLDATASRDASAPTVPGGSDYLHLVATRR
jgi:hypothetical protein